MNVYESRLKFLTKRNVKNYGWNLFTAIGELIAFSSYGLHSPTIKDFIPSQILAADNFRAFLPALS